MRKADHYLEVILDSRIIKGYLFAIASAIIYGCMPLMSKYIYDDGVTPFTLVFFRNFFSLVPLAILAYRESGTLKISAKKLPTITLISVLGCSATPMLLFSSYRFISSGTATVFHFAYPAMVVIGEMLFLRKRPRPVSLASVLLCVVGVSLFYSTGQSVDLFGGGLALLSGVTFASYVILLSRFDKGGVRGFLFTFYVVLISSIVSFAACVATNSLALPQTWFGWGLCVLFSLLVTTGAVVLFQQSTFLIGGRRSSILSTLEPITGVLIGAFIFNEPMGAKAIVGVVLVILASVLTAAMDIKKKRLD